MESALQAQRRSEAILGALSCRATVPQAWAVVMGDCHSPGAEIHLRRIHCVGEQDDRQEEHEAQVADVQLRCPEGSAVLARLSLARKTSNHVPVWQTSLGNR